MYNKAMSLSIGIVGLPNVGKSTLFNALLKQNLALAANYPFATIEPNVGIATVPDDRLAVLAPLVKTTVIKPATIEFVDIAGLVRGASLGEGLGNKFLAHIKATSAIAHVLRVFQDSEIIREQAVNPEADLQIVRLELQLADLAVVERQTPPKGSTSSADKKRWQQIAAFKKCLDANQNLSTYMQSLTSPEERLLAETLAKELNLLTSKAEIFILNVSEAELAQSDELIKQWAKKLAVPQSQIVIAAAKVEAELMALTEDEQKLFLSELGIKESGLDRLARVAYATLKLQSFLTAGELEVRAWTIPQNTPAPQAAGVIHTDFITKFIKAKVCSFADFVHYRGWKEAAAAGKVRLEGKDYLMQPDDIVEFILAN
jgi:GTP-binding protein YchF